MTSKEALETIGMTKTNNIKSESLSKPRVMYLVKELRKKEIQIIKQDLDKLEKLESELKRKSGIICMLESENESLRSENEILKKSIENSNKAFDVLMQNSNIQFLNQNQEIFKLKKVIDILKRFVTISYCRNEETNKWDIPFMYYFGFSEKITQEEYDLLKEYLGNVEDKR